MQPHEFPERILLCVAGNTPPIITENLFALAVRIPGRFESPIPAFVPTEIVVLTTEEGKSTCEKRGLEKQIESLCMQYAIEIPDLCYELLRSSDGLTLKDVRTTTDNLAVADQISRIVRELSQREDCAIHASLAGGRKTMSSNLQLAVQLYGRKQDRLSHVLVNPLFEFGTQALRALFFPPLQAEHFEIADAQGNTNTISSDRMDIQLAYIDFLPMRQGLPERLLTGNVSLEHAIHSARSALVEPSARVDLLRTEIHLGPERLKFKRDHALCFGLYSFLLWWRKNYSTGITMQDIFHKKEFLRPFFITNKINGDHASKNPMHDALEDEWKRICLTATKHLLEDKLQPKISTINTSILENLGPLYHSAYMIRNINPDEPIQRYIQLPPGSISFEPEPCPATTAQITADIQIAKHQPPADRTRKKQ